MVDLDALTGLDAEGVCVAAGRVQVEMVAAETARFVLAAHWADLHSGEELEGSRRRSGRRVLPGMERARRAGADGTPLVAEFAAMELGALLGMGYVAAGCFLRDAVNVRHRHPGLWAALGRGEARVWQARRVAAMCASAGLGRDRARWVDAVTTPYVAGLPWSRFESLVEAKIVEADPEAAEARRVAAAMARFVRTGQSGEFGLKTLVARAAAGDVIFFVAMVDRIAEILLLRGDADPVDVRRSKAIGILATPERALSMLQRAAAEHAAAGTGGGAGTGGDAGSGGDAGTGGDAGSGERDDAAAGVPGGGDRVDDPETVGELDVHPACNDADDPAPQPRPCPACAGVGAVTGDPAAFVRAGSGWDRVDPRRLLPEATLYVHLSEEALRTGTGVARMEGVGPITVGQVREFLGQTNVRVVPVLDLAGQRPVDGYEVPARMGEAVHLRSPACVSPWGTNLSRGKDADHVVPYLSPDRGGPPGQTRMDNLAPLARFPHRVKTHGRWRLRQPGPGVFEWRSPHGYWFRVDHRGTHPLGRDPEQTRHPGHEAGHEAAPAPVRLAPGAMTRLGAGELYEAPVRLDPAEFDAHVA